MKVDIIHGRCSGPQHGLSRYNHEIVHNNPDIDFNCICYPGFPSIPLLDGFVKRYVYPFIVKREIKQKSIIHITNQSLSFMLSGIHNRSIITCHDLYPIANTHSRSGYWEKNISALESSSKIIAISQFTKTEIIRLTKCDPEKVSVIYNGVDHKHFYPNPDPLKRERLGIPAEQKIILYVGSEEPRKNLPGLLKAVSGLVDSFPETCLLKVGGSQMGGDRAIFLKEIHRYGLDSQVKIIDQVNEEILPDFYNIADIFVFPSYYEGFGLPVLEAMACGIPVISSSIPPINEIVGNSGILIDPDDTKGFIGAISGCLEDEKFAKRLGNEGWQRSQLFSWEKTAALTRDLYESLLL